MMKLFIQNLCFAAILLAFIYSGIAFVSWDILWAEQAPIIFRFLTAISFSLAIAATIEMSTNNPESED